MYVYACAALWVAALGLNVRDQRALTLAFFVGASVLVSVPAETPLQFYAFCISVEILVGIYAYRSHRAAGYLIANVCSLLVMAHVMGYVWDGWTSLSPYKGIVRILEVSQLLICVAFSPTLTPILRNRDATTT